MFTYLNNQRNAIWLKATMKWKHPWWLSWYYVYIKIYHSVMQHTAAKYLWCKTTGVSLDYLSNPPDALSRNSIQCSTGIILKSETSEDTENRPSCQSPIHTAIYSANTATYLGESSTQKIMFCLITINNPITSSSVKESGLHELSSEHLVCCPVLSSGHQSVRVTLWWQVPCLEGYSSYLTTVTAGMYQGY